MLFGQICLRKGESLELIRLRNTLKVKDTFERN